MGNQPSEQGQILMSFLLLLVLGGLLIVGVYMLDQFGLIEARRQIYRAVEYIPYVGETLVPSPMSRVDYRKERLRKLEELLDKREEELENRQRSLNQRAQRLQQEQRELERLDQSLSQREKALLDRKQRFQQQDERYAQLADLYSNMRPEDAARRLQGIQEDEIVIDILRQMETRSSSIILSNMNPDRAARLTRKMARYPQPPASR